MQSVKWVSKALAAKEVSRVGGVEGLIKGLCQCLFAGPETLGEIGESGWVGRRAEMHKKVKTQICIIIRWLSFRRIAYLGKEGS